MDGNPKKNENLEDEIEIKGMKAWDKLLAKFGED